MYKIIKIIVIAIVAILIVAFATAGDRAKGSLKIGVIAPLTGVIADYGEEIRKGVMAVASTTTDVEFVFEDDKCEPKDAVSAFTKLTSIDKVAVILGPACGSPQEAIVPLVANDSAVVLVMSAASKELYAKSNKNFFNVQYSLEDESTFMANKLTELGYKKVALVTYKNAFSDTHSKAFKAAYKGLVFNHVLLENSTDLSPEMAKIKAEKPDVIYAPDIAFFFAGGTLKLEQYGIKVPVYSSYVAELPAARTLVPNVNYSFPGDLGGEQGAVYELSKVAAQLAVDVVKECGSNPKCVKEKLTSSGKFDENGIYRRSFVIKQIPPFTGSEEKALR